MKGTIKSALTVAGAYTIARYGPEAMDREFGKSFISSYKDGSDAKLDS